MADEEILGFLGGRLIQLRTDRRLTQAALAEILGISTRYLRRLEKGEVNSSLLQLARFARLLDVAPKELIRPLMLPDRTPGRPRKVSNAL